MKYTNPVVYSSYRENDLGKTLYDQVLLHKPKKIVEFGTLYGYSTIAMAMALDELGEGKIYSYDLWGDYQHRKADKNITIENLRSYNVSKYVELLTGDFSKFNDTFDLLHVDISNTGDTLKKLAKLKGGVILFEGGTPERDRVGWMTKYNKQPMTTAGVKYEVLNPAFPGLSKLI